MKTTLKAGNLERSELPAAREGGLEAWKLYCGNSATLAGRRPLVSAAKQHIDEALELLDDALAKRPGPKPSARAIRSYIAEARLVLTQSDSSRAVWALSEALRALEPEEGRAVTNDS